MLALLRDGLPPRPHDRQREVLLALLREGRDPGADGDGAAAVEEGVKNGHLSISHSRKKINILLFFFSSLIRTFDRKTLLEDLNSKGEKLSDCKSRREEEARAYRDKEDKIGAMEREMAIVRGETVRMPLLFCIF